MAEKKLKVAILDDHHTHIVGYRELLRDASDIRIVALLSAVEELWPVLNQHPDLNVLIMDLEIPSSMSDGVPYPVMELLQALLGEEHARTPDLGILVIASMARPELVHSLAQLGISGYILNEDQAMLADLPNLVKTVADRGVCYSQKVYQVLMQQPDMREGERLTPRQMQALSIAAANPDSTTAALASQLGCSNSTFRNLLSGVYFKLKVRTRAAAIARARELDLLNGPVMAVQPVAPVRVAARSEPAVKERGRKRVPA